VLPRFHTRPINVAVYDGSIGRICFHVIFCKKTFNVNTIILFIYNNTQQWVNFLNEFYYNFYKKKYFLYIVFITIYKKYANIFKFIEGNQYKFIKYSKIQNAIDVGSNNFQTAKIILSYKNVKIFCYDPIKLKNKNISKFKKNIIFNNYALWNKNGKIKFFIPYFKNFELSSLATCFKIFLRNYFKKFKISMKKITIKEKVIICRKLDNKNLNFQFLKIDVEGSELQILKGAQKNIKKNNPIILLEKNRDFYKIKKFMKELKYNHYNYYNYYEKKFQNIKNLKQLENIYFLNKESKKLL
jgi:FkbM family methyltransferase